jgi:hypothetical protein
MEPDRVPSLANSQSLPRLEYDIPTIPSRGLPPTRDVVSSPFDDVGRLGSEGRFVDDPIAASQQAYQAKAAADAERAVAMKNEGGTFVDELVRKRELAAEGEAAYKARQLATAEDDGMMAAKSPYASKKAADEAAYQAQIDDMINEGGGGAISRTPPPGTRFTLGESSSSGVYRPDFTRPEGSRFGLPALRGSTDVTATGTPASASAAGGYDINAILRMLGGAGMGGGATAVALDIANDLRGQGPANARTSPNQAETPAPNNLGLPTAEPAAALYGLESPNLGLPTPAPAAALYGLNSPASRSGSGRQSTASQQQPAASPSSAALFEAYNQSMRDDGGGRADLFERARKAKMEEEGLARGGAANGSNRSTSGGKDAAIHKALEIIHHMMVNR